MADSCMDWILRTINADEENEERFAGPTRNRRTLASSLSRTYRRIFRIEKPPRLMVRPWPTTTETTPRQRKSRSQETAADALQSLRAALRSLTEIDKDIKSTFNQIHAGEEILGVYLYDAAPLALREDDKLATALADQVSVSQDLKKLQSSQAAQRQALRSLGDRLCKGEAGQILTPDFDKLLRPLLISMDSALDARAEIKQLTTQLEVLQQLSGRSHCLFMASGKGWRVPPIKVTSRLKEVTEQLHFLQLTQPSRERVMENNLSAMFRSKTTQAWTQSKKSVQDLVAAEQYRSAVEELAVNRQQLDNRDAYYDQAVLNKEADETPTQIGLTYLQNVLDVTHNIFFYEENVRSTRKAALAAGADLICLGEIQNDHLTEIGYDEGFSEDGKAASESPEELRKDDVLFQVKVDGILKWQAGLGDSIDDVAIPPSPPSAALSDTSQYYQRNPWDDSADLYDRRLLPWDSVTFREDRLGMQVRIETERRHREETRSMLEREAPEGEQLFSNWRPRPSDDSRVMSPPPYQYRRDSDGNYRACSPGSPFLGFRHGRSMDYRFYDASRN